MTDTKTQTTLSPQAHELASQIENHFRDRFGNKWFGLGPEPRAAIQRALDQEHNEAIDACMRQDCHFDHSTLKRTETP